jgi:23S rRNA (cytidine2498-2'-O)-methyltransferase
MSTEHAILTASSASGHVALTEIRTIDPGARLRQWLEPGVGWVELGMGWDVLAARLREQPPVFCRHICPIQALIPLEQAMTDLDALMGASRQFIPLLNATQPFSVQTRLVGEGWPYARYDVNERLSQTLMKQGLSLDVRHPEQILSVVLASTVGYLGLSRAADNLSDWAGGVRRFKWEQDQISRAEFKLLEALEVFKLRVPPNGVALDLGAAPGGWTRILRQNGMQVTAVDPGDLDPRIAVDSLVRHIRQTAQGYLPRTRETFDVILNDMRMDARDSAHIMLSALNHLRESGWALLTLKLPERKAEVVAASALAMLREGCQVIGARQLFHNRSEITVALRRCRY